MRITGKAKRFSSRDVPLGGTGWRSALLDGPQEGGLLVTVSRPEKNGPIGADPLLVGWDMRNLKRLFRVNVDSISCRLRHAPAAKHILLQPHRRSRARPIKLHVHSPLNGKPTHVLEFASGTPQPRGISWDGTTGLDTDKDGHLVRFPLFPEPEPEAPDDGE